MPSVQPAPAMRLSPWATALVYFYLVNLGCDLILAVAAGVFRGAAFYKQVPRPWLKVRFLRGFWREGQLVSPQLLPLPPSLPWTTGQVCVPMCAGDDSPIPPSEVKLKIQRSALRCL